MNRYDPDIHHRRSIRLKDNDYSKVGAYFITICTYGRECLFGEIVNGFMQMNEYGQIVAAEWIRLGELQAEIETKISVVMPNHFHGIVNLTDDIAPRNVEAIHELPLHNELPQRQKRRQMALPKIVGRF